MCGCEQCPTMALYTYWCLQLQMWANIPPLLPVEVFKIVCCLKHNNTGLIKEAWMLVSVTFLNFPSSDTNKRRQNKVVSWTIAQRIPAMKSLILTKFSSVSVTRNKCLDALIHWYSKTDLFTQSFHFDSLPFCITNQEMSPWKQTHNPALVATKHNRLIWRK